MNQVRCCAARWVTEFAGLCSNTLMQPAHPSGASRLELDVQSWNAGQYGALQLRPIAIDDFQRIRNFIDRMSFGSRYFRFGRGDYRPDDVQIEMLCSPDPATRRQLVITTPWQGDEVIVASGRIDRQDDGGCEFAVIVLDAWQGLGLGQRLMEQLKQQARDWGRTHMVGRVLGTNRRMLQLAVQQGFVLDAATAGHPIKRVIAPL